MPRLTIKYLRHINAGDILKPVLKETDALQLAGLMSLAKDELAGRQAVVESTRENPTIIESTTVLGNTVRVRAGCKLIRTRVNPGLTLPRSMTYVDKFLRSYEDVVQLAA